MQYEFFLRQYVYLLMPLVNLNLRIYVRSTPCNKTALSFTLPSAIAIGNDIYADITVCLSRATCELRLSTEKYDRKRPKKAISAHLIESGEIEIGDRRAKLSSAGLMLNSKYRRIGQFQVKKSIWFRHEEMALKPEQF